MNQINIIGRLVADVKTNQTQDRTLICSGRIAVPRIYAQKEGQEPITDFFDFSAFRGTAEIISKYCQKGKRVALSGTLQNHSWTDQQGQGHTKTIILVNGVTLIDKKDQVENAQQQQYQQPNNNYYQQQPQAPQQNFYQPQQQYQQTQPNFNKPQQNYVEVDDLSWLK